MLKICIYHKLAARVPFDIWQTDILYTSIGPIFKFKFLCHCNGFNLALRLPPYDISLPIRTALPDKHFQDYFVFYNVFESQRTAFYAHNSKQLQHKLLSSFRRSLISFSFINENGSFPPNSATLACTAYVNNALGISNITLYTNSLPFASWQSRSRFLKTAIALRSRT